MAKHKRFKRLAKGSAREVEGRRPSNRARPRSQDHPGGAEGRRVWLFGVHPVLAALGNPGRTCHRLLMMRQAADSLVSRLESLGREVPRPRAEIVDRKDIESLLPPGVVHQGVAVLAGPLAEVSIEEICQNTSDSALVVVLDQATDPHNVGAVVRSAAAFGAVGVVMQDRHAPDTQGILAKTASGALETVPLVRVTNLVLAMELLKKAQYWCIGLDSAARDTLSASKLSGRTALILGSEGEGLRRLVAENCDLLVRIPISGMESLNLSNAAAIALYEATRQT